MSSFRKSTPYRAFARIAPWALILAFAGLAANTAAASPVVSLRDVGLSSQGDFDRGCAFVGQRLYCWGSNLNGSLGIGTVSLTSLAEWVRRPDVESGEFDRPSSLAVSSWSCVTDAAGAWCWGLNNQGQLGLGDVQARTAPVHVPGLPEGVVEVTQGLRHSCVRTLATGLWCWGGNEFGETGQVPGVPLPGQVVPPPQTLASRVPIVPQVVTAVGLGDQYSCALASGQVWCWGRNDRGQLGDATVISRAQPARVIGLPEGITQLATSPRHACVIDATREVWCWGNNESAEIGVSPSSGRLIETTPLHLGTLGGPAAALHLEFAQSCARVSGERRCWGVADDGSPLGAQPRALAPPAGAPADWLDGCFDRTGELQCRSGFGRYPGTALDAQAVPGLGGRATRLALGRDFACAVLADGAVWCWGDNARGQLGQGDVIARTSAVRVPLPPASALITGARHACALIGDALWCWGANDTGALGDGTLIDRAAPVRAQFAGPLLAAGDGYTCAYANVASGLHCWGRNDVGQTSGQASAPVIGAAMPLGFAPIIELSGGAAHACAVLQLASGAREVRCWGNLPISAEEAATGVTNFSPRLLTPGDPLPAGNSTLLRSASFSTCAGDRCFGLNYLPPDRGQRRVDLAIALPSSSVRAFALGGRHACVLGAGTDASCAGLIGRACVVDQYLGLLLTPGQMIGCSFGESMLTALQRDWAAVVGIPAIPSLLEASEQYACAAAADGVWCWGLLAPINHLPSGQAFAPIYRAGAVEPAAAVPVVLDARLACPAFLVSSVSLLNPARSDEAGAWGQEVLVIGGNRQLNGGLNFGGYATPTVPGYAAFSITNPRAGAQTVTLDLRGDGGVFDLRVLSTRPPSLQGTEMLRERVTLGSSVLRRSLALADGFHIIVLQPIAGNPLFLAVVATTQADGTPAAFQGGAVVGGYLSGGQTGFAAICTDTAGSLSIRSEARSARGAIGAGDLRVRLLDGQTGALVYDSAVH